MTLTDRISTRVWKILRTLSALLFVVLIAIAVTMRQQIGGWNALVFWAMGFAMATAAIIHFVVLKDRKEVRLNHSSCCR